MQRITALNEFCFFTKQFVLSVMILNLSTSIFISIFGLQLLDTGFFHADPHPGNMIRTPDGKLAILDFGNNFLSGSIS